jgi:hypothetical protein
MKQIRENFLHVATVMGYMWAGWLCANDEKWYWIIVVIALAAIVQTAGIEASVKNSKEEK